MRVRPAHRSSGAAVARTRAEPPWRTGPVGPVRPVACGRTPLASAHYGRARPSARRHGGTPPPRRKVCTTLQRPLFAWRGGTMFDGELHVAQVAVVVSSVRRWSPSSTCERRWSVFSSSGARRRGLRRRRPRPGRRAGGRQACTSRSGRCRSSASRAAHSAAARLSADPSTPAMTATACAHLLRLVLLGTAGVFLRRLGRVGTARALPWPIRPSAGRPVLPRSARKGGSRWSHGRGWAAHEAWLRDLRLEREPPAVPPCPGRLDRGETAEAAVLPSG
ncbi:hypothetical protein S1361_06090 [Streptomyces cyanogenus]|uniref:Uncharacterized protein n=1 Tax=Streptomyces cyanogenus TaxID=80860 RepID=A0ABX7TMS8_STRCY|nr:hypothetical protein S1361_06090 [Streptomyces cyanogenus]